MHVIMSRKEVELPLPKVQPLLECGLGLSAPKMKAHHTFCRIQKFHLGKEEQVEDHLS